MEMFMDYITKDLQPFEVFRYFEELCQIPHGSGNVKEISDYCVQFAKLHQLKYRQDESYNVIIWKPASKGYEDKQTVILQGHLDMVAVKTADCNKDMKTEGLDLVIEGDYLYAKNTSLGADDGIAVAYSLALLASDSIEHPALEVIFTVDEEIGMLGATAMDLSDIKGRRMLNIDSEEEGYLLAGCAGGATVKCKLKKEYHDFTGIHFDLTICGATGGHSGVEIDKQRANTNELIGRLLDVLISRFEMKIKGIYGGEKDNAIATSSTAQLVALEKDRQKIEAVIESELKVYQNEYAVTDPQLNIKVEWKDSAKASCLTDVCGEKIVLLLNMLPNGVVKMSNDIKGLVQTSLNLGMTKDDADCIELCYLIRSALESEKNYLIRKLTLLTEYIDDICLVEGHYPAWEFMRESPLREKMECVYEKMYGKKAIIQTIHAGLECGIIADKLPGLDCISFGPDIQYIHTTREKLSISSTKRVWEYLIALLKEI